MRHLVLAGLAAASLLAFAPAVSADSVITQSVQLCRTTAASQAGIDVDHAALDQVRTRGRAVIVDLNVWKSGRVTRARCEVSTAGSTLTVASIDPPLQAASAQN